MRARTAIACWLVVALASGALAAMVFHDHPIVAYALPAWLPDLERLEPAAVLGVVATILALTAAGIWGIMRWSLIEPVPRHAAATPISTQLLRAAAWVTAALLTQLFKYDLIGALASLAALPLFAVWAAGLLVLAIGVWEARTPRLKVPDLGVVAATAVAAAALWVYGDAIGVHGRLHRLEPRYQHTIARWEAEARAGTLGRETVAADGYLVEPGPPVRIAWVWSGVVDNWSGVVYDPSGLVMDAERHRPQFGGVRISCEPVRGPWYFCSCA